MSLEELDLLDSELLETEESEDLLDESDEMLELLRFEDMIYS